MKFSFTAEKALHVRRKKLKSSPEQSGQMNSDRLMGGNFLGMQCEAEDHIIKKPKLKYGIQSSLKLELLARCNYF